MTEEKDLEQVVNSVERARNNFAWHKNPEGGVRGLLFSAEKVRELAEKKHRKNYWNIGALIGTGIAALLGGLFYFSQPETEVIFENLEKEEMKAEMPFNVVDTYDGISWFDTSLGLDSLLAVDNLIESVMSDFCFVSASDDSGTICLETSCLKYETKPNKIYDKETGNVKVSFEKRCVEEELKEIVGYSLNDIKDVKVEFNKEHTPRLVLKFKNDEPNLVIDKDEERVFESIITGLRVSGKLESARGITEYRLRTSTVSEVLSDAKFFIDLVLELEVQLGLNLGDEINSEQLEKARIEFRYVEHISSYSLIWNELFGGITDEYMYDDETSYRLIAIDFYFKGFQSDDERRISIPASRLDYNNGLAFLIKNIAEYDLEGDQLKQKLNVKEVYPITHSFFPDESENNPTRIVTRTFMAFEADTKEIIIAHNPTLSNEENMSLMMQLADAFRTPIEFLSLIYKDMYNKDGLKLLYKRSK